MMQKLIKCAILGGLVLFIWSAVAWSVLPWNKMQMLKFKDQGKVARVVLDNVSESGVYLLPNMRDIPKGSTAMAEAQDNMRQGPYIFASVCLKGRNPDMMIPLAKELLLKIVVAFLVTWLVMQTRLNYKRKVGFVTVAGIVIGMVATLPYGIWFGFPMGFIVACGLETIFGWFFAGLVIAKFSK